jgi:hypothetical protein
MIFEMARRAKLLNQFTHLQLLQRCAASCRRGRASVGIIADALRKSEAPTTANWEQAQSSFFTFNPLDFAHFCRANDQIDAKGKQLATTAANKALMLQACPPATSGPFALV